MNNKIDEQVGELLHLPDEQKNSTASASSDGQGTIEIIDVYVVTRRVKEPHNPEPPIVESSVEPPHEQDFQETTEFDAVTTPRQSERHPRIFLTVLAALCFLILIGGGLFSLLSLMAPSATVTIVPTSAQVESTTTVSVMPGTANRALGQVPGRVLSSLMMSETRTVAATGIVHQDATQARGTVIFYNGLIQPQMIPAGTLLISNEGVQVVTDQDAYIPRASLPSPGQVEVPAHALNAGPQGNINADTIYGPCCRAYVSVQNTQPFTGGHNARTYRTVSRQDTNRAVSLLSIDLGRSMQVAFQEQLNVGETLVTPLPCQQTVTTDHVTGEEAEQVRITLSETCTGEAYNSQAYRELITLILNNEAMQRLGKGYLPAGDIQMTTDKVVVKDHHPIYLEVRGVGTWVYRFSQPQLRNVKAIIAGKSRKEAVRILLRVSGIRTITLTLRNGATVPANVGNIQIIVLEAT